MPNHGHLILPRESKNVESRLGGLLGSVSKSLGKTNLWQPLPPGEDIPDDKHLRRTVRYVALNPCRAQLCRDPLEWYWSSHREMMGATVEKPPRNLVAFVRETCQASIAQFHLYISSDPTVSVRGTQPPIPASPSEFAEYPISGILNAAAAALRMPVEDIKTSPRLRALFVHLAYRHGWDRATLLAKICDIHPQSVRKIRARMAPDGISAGDLCLGDLRLSGSGSRREN